MEKLNDEQIDRHLSAWQGWERDGEKWIRKKYRFRDYLTGIEFVHRLAQHAEEMNHHPFISIDYKLITVKLTTWNAGGLTMLDMDSAGAYDSIFEQIGE